MPESYKNNVKDSTLNAGGNMHIGDIINFNLSREVFTEEGLLTKEIKEGIKLLISKGDMEKAIDLLLGHAKQLDNSIFNELISIARQWEELQRDVRIGVLSSDEKFRLSSKITFALLNSADALQRKKH